MKIVQILYYLAAAIAAFGAFLTYLNNSRRERAKWAVQLYEKFYEACQYKGIRDKLDCEANADEVVQLVTDESAKFTDYLNFFEMVCFLAKTNQVSERDVKGLFQYYLLCLKRHPTVMAYLNNKEKDFEQLSEFLKKTKLESNRP